MATTQKLKKCYQCGTEAAGDSKKCVSCGAILGMAKPDGIANTPEEEKKVKLVAGIGCGGLLLLGLIFGVFRTEKHDGSASTPDAPSIKVVSGTRKSIGESFSLGDYTYKIAKAGTTQKVGSQFMNVVASNGATFVVVEFTILNNSKETQTVMTDDFILTDNQDRRFSPHSGANTALLSTGKDFILTQLQPGIEKSSATVFEVPKNAIQPGLRIEIPEKGLLGSGKVIVDLIK